VDGAGARGESPFAEAAALLNILISIPHARLDDLMSAMRQGRRCRAHFDSYDVFLLQGLGHRAGRFPRRRMAR